MENGQCKRMNPDPQLEKWRRQYFMAVLDNHMIGTAIPPGYGPKSGHLWDIPKLGDPKYVEISGDEREIERPEPAETHSIDELRMSYYVQSMKSVATTDLNVPFEDSESEESASENESTDLRIDYLPEVCREGLPGERLLGVSGLFRTREEFEQHRREIATDLKKLSEDLGLPEDLKICAVATCVNNALPGSKFCISHFGLDPDFDKQKLYGRCRHISKGQRCCVPCLSKERYCPSHAAKNAPR